LGIVYALAAVGQTAAREDLIARLSPEQQMS
jgi:hypothetical protein